MTLIVALRCRDGVILGSDSQEMRGVQGRRLARSTRKIDEPRPGFLLAWAGARDVAQSFALRVKRADGLTPDDDRLGIGGSVQMGTVQKNRLEIIRAAAMRGLHDTVDLWESQCAELLLGATEPPSASATPDRGVRPPD